jgi:hypothetical protein
VNKLVYIGEHILHGNCKWSRTLHFTCIFMFNIESVMFQWFRFDLNRCNRRDQKKYLAQIHISGAQTMYWGTKMLSEALNTVFGQPNGYCFKCF